MQHRLVVGLALVALVGGCKTDSTKANNRDTMTQRQRDSVFGQSAVPGASAVTKAQAAADTLNARRARQDSAMKVDTTFNR